MCQSLLALLHILHSNDFAPVEVNFKLNYDPLLDPNAGDIWMKALVLNGYGSDDKIEFAETNMPDPQANEVLVQVKAAPVNPSDLIFISGKNPGARKVPLIPGFEGSGIVVKSGGGARADELVGKRVSFRAKPNHGGSWAEFAVTDADKCIPLLPEVSLVQGSMLQVNPLTAWSLVDCAQKAGHHCAIQNAAASALGRMVIRFAAKRKLDLINIVRRPEQVKILADLGGSNVCDSSEPDFENQLSSLSSQLGATVAFDAIAGDATQQLLKVMAQQSEVWVYGGLSGAPSVVDPILLIYGQRSVRGFWGPPAFYALDENEFAAGIAEIQGGMSNIFGSEVKATYPLQDFRKGLDLYRSEMTGGKVLFSMDNETAGVTG